MTERALPRGRPLALVVDDEPANRALLARIVGGQGFDVIEGGDGEDAVRLAAERRPDLILLDVLMPKKSGFTALEEIREANPHVPVVIVTGGDQADAGERAMSLGAVNFVRKPFDVQEIRFVVDRIRAALEEEADILPTLKLLRERRTVLEFGSDVALLSPVVAFLGRELRLHYPAHDVPLTEAKLALYESLANAIEHGNLEIGYEAKSQAFSTEGGVHALIEQRRADERYRGRLVRVEASYEPGRVTYVVRDSGPGFPHASPAHRQRLGDTDALHGRGILLIRHYMHEVVWNASGNEVRMSIAVPPRARAAD